jgi:uncharacterized membrane protein YozB (DUF420 family)
MESSSSLPIVLADPSFDGIGGFLPLGRGSVMLDVVFVAMFVVVPALAASIYLVKVRGRYALHKKLQLVLASVLLVAVLLFEIDMQFITKWETRAEPSPYFAEANKWTCPAGISLLVHLSFAVPTLLLWIYVVVQALRHFSRPPAPGPHSAAHARWAWAASAGMLLTAITGWVFYWLAFVAV